MEDKTLVSICIISYNSAEFVLETLKSAKEQGYKHIELIISDDGSTDATVELCKKWLQKNENRFQRTELITVDANTGIPANCNRAVRAARGEWIKLIAADDILLKDCITDNIKYIRKNSETELLFSAMRPFLIENKEKKFFEPVKLSQTFLDLNADQQFVEIIFGKMEGVAPTAFIAKELFDKLGYYDEEFKLAEDYTFWLKCTANQIRFVSMDKLTVLYRYHSNNTGVVKVLNGTLYRDRIRIFKQYLSRLLANENGRTEFAKYYKANCFSFIKFCTESENLELLQNVKKTAKISNLYYLMMRKYLLTFSKNNIRSRLLRSFCYRILIHQE
ncbi:glycosyltransferase [Chryseobacterium koreense]